MLTTKMFAVFKQKLYELHFHVVVPRERTNPSIKSRVQQMSLAAEESPLDVAMRNDAQRDAKMHTEAELVFRKEHGAGQMGMD